ncbi:TetR/AcrR family transcriptional regulator [Georgenia yuyongxinii]|uniref:TetR/AcrR family transcriptional regulator n=1 Tax=Georgenia yuyongxinii TaxID=2589797 RepID=A0A552WXR9_9MICO|nr:TetR/AcrR family transcriptional regulator [Georgenia yuyongxinii]TRW47485.1 TetR/AcrR family transcriptional regulator [Georgenia yuyongxinii]
MTQQQSPAAEQPPVRRGPGRPRHADTEARAYRAVLELFGQKGWSGLSLDGVATHAGIGKSSIYLRWKDKRDLLMDALHDLEEHLVVPEETENLKIRDYLVAHATARAELYLGEHGSALSHLYSAAHANPSEFAEIRQQNISRGILSLHGRIEKAVADGELPKDTSVFHLLDAIEGAVLVHVLFSSPKNNEDLSTGIGEYVRKLVDIQLRGIGATV